MSNHTNLLDRNNAMLLVIDVQDRIDSVMCDQGHRARIAALMDGCAALDVPVIVTEQYPKGLGPTVPNLAERLINPAIEKETFSCARAPAASAAVKKLDRGQVIVTGIEAHVCVMQTVADLLAAGYEVHVPHDGVNSRRRADRDWALRRMEATGAVITSTESVLFELLERSGTDDFKIVAALIKNIPV